MASRLIELGFPADLGGYLRQRYLRDGWAVLVIARELGIGNAKIKNALDAAGVIRRHPGGADTARAWWQPRTAGE